jgi:tetratricopeptide (TPR) repeat protein
VLGRDFTYPLLRAVAEADEPALQASLDRLAEADLLFVEGAPPEANYRFKHALIQDAAYESLLKSRRQALHRRVAELLRDQPERVAAAPEVIAHHFTQAGLDDLAIEWWGKAGDQALRRSAFQEAIAHLGKAIEMTDSRATASAPPAAAGVGSAAERLKLQTRYARAMMYSKGWASEEAKAGFARAQELVEGVGDIDERFATLYGLWVTSLVRGELRMSQEVAEAFRREAENCGRVTEAAVANRFLGFTSYCQGDFIKAKAHLEEALRLYDGERDRETKFRFGLDTHFAATLYLAPVTLALGDIEGARRLIEESVARAVESGHVLDLTNAYTYKASNEGTLGDAEAALRTTEIHAEICRRHQVESPGPLTLLSAWARARLGDRKISIAELRRAIAATLEKNLKVFIPWVQGELAELEAEEGDLEGALARIDEALALARELGAHLSDVFLHRLRGEITLKRDPGNPAPAEEAFQTALAIADRQGGRLYGLRAALSLAKLYQSTGRLAETHGVLAPALVGFSPTLEMPEIAEAQSLLAANEAGAHVSPE